MLNAMTTSDNHHNTPSAIIVSSPAPQIDLDWLNYFDLDMALKATFSHIAALPGTKNTPEKHTARAYQSGLFYFLEWSADRLPTPGLIKEFIAHLSIKSNHRTKSTGLASSTIASKYLAPVRLYLKALAGQMIVGNAGNTHIITNYREQIRAAALIKNPGADKKSNISALLRHGTRLTKRQLKKIIKEARDRSDTIAGKRDLALLRTAFYTGLRLAEMQRMTLSSIEEIDDDVYTVTVRGKRNNHDPVAITDKAVDAINDYVQAYNDMLPIGDTRRIGQDTPIWQSLTRSGNHLPINHQTGTNKRTKQPTFYKPSNGMSMSGLSGIIRRLAGIAPHDTRRTFAYLAFKSGMAIEWISQQMRHSSILVTQNYIGYDPNYKKADLSKYLDIG